MPGRDAPWLVSFALWANVLQYLDPATTVAESARPGTDAPAAPRWPASLGIRDDHASCR